MKTKKLKKLTASEKKKFIFKEGSYDWDFNYDTMIELRFNDSEYSYDSGLRCNLIDGKAITDVDYFDFIKQFKELVEYAQMNMTNQNNIKAAITRKCKLNTFNSVKEAKEKEKEEKEKEKEEKKRLAKAEKEKAKAEKEKAKAEFIYDLPNKVYNYVKTEYGNVLEFNNTTKKVYLNSQIINKNDYTKIQDDVERHISYSTFAMKKLESIIYDIAKEKTFVEKIDTGNEVDDTFNILKDIDEDNWEESLKTDEKGRLMHSIFNYAAFFNFHPQFKGKIKMNGFTKVESLERYDEAYKNVVEKPIDDMEADLIKSYIENYFGNCNERIFDTALNITLLKNNCHPIKEMFRENKGKWDGIPRVREMMVKYFDCPDIEPVHEMTEIMMCGAYQRIVEERPDSGCPFDFMGIIFGLQGTGKTKFFTRLFGTPYTILNPDVTDDQKFVDLTNRAWLVLFDEMKGINKADMPTVKSRITEQGSTVRLSYGRRSKYYPRHCVYWGNTNYQYILRDEGYERRFLCFESLTTEEMKHSVQWWNENYTDYIIQQLWAETGEIYEQKYKGRIIHLSEKTLEYNMTVQLRHKVWNDDSRTELEIQSILDYEHYDKFFYKDSDYRIWMIENDEIRKKNDEKMNGFPLKIIKKQWICSRFNRKNEWIDGIISKFGWHIEHIEDLEIGKGDYYLAPNVTWQLLKTMYENEYKNKDINTLTLNENIFFGT